jgi:hypothetical protein
VRKNFIRRPLQQRIVALVAAYAIALSSLIASFGAARAAAVVAADPGGVICHTLRGAPTPSGHEDNGKTCADNCCVGCLMLMAAMPPAPVSAAAAPQLAKQTFAPLATEVFAGGPAAKSHRSRAPPLTA